MPVPILMPALSPTMETGKLAKWHVKEGDSVQPGDVIAEIETDKATMEVEAIEEGRIGKLYVEEGSGDVAVNTQIAVVLTEDDGDDVDLSQSATPVEATNAQAEEAASDDQDPIPTTKQTGGNVNPVSGAKEMSDVSEHAVPAKSVSPKSGDRPFASPLARKIARENNLPLSSLSGSGPRGRIIKKDVLMALQNVGAVGAATDAERARETAAAVAGSLATTTASLGAAKPPASALDDREIVSLYEEGSYEVVPHENMRRIIAERLTLAKTSIPHFYLTIDCNLDELLLARKRMNEAIEADGTRLSVNDFIIKALALSLQKVPDANATWTAQGMLKHKRSDIAVAVAVEGGLFTPVVRHADLKTLSEISNEMKDLAHRARHKKLAPHEYQGGTTSISNLGMYDIKQFDAVINPPHASILAVGRGEQRPIVKGGELSVANIMSCSLSCDHRVIDGALGAELLKAFKGYIEEPVTMLV